MLQSVRTGEHAWKLEGTDVFDAMQADPEEAEIFNQAMFELTKRAAVNVADAYDFSGLREIVDVGGGYGTLVAEILAAHPRMHGVIFDLPHARDGAERLLEEKQLAGRAEFVAGELLLRGAGESGRILLKSVIHDWDDERSLAILRNCRAAMLENARLLLIEPLAPERVRSSPFDGIIVGSDLNMLVNTGGWERTEAEYRELLEAADLHVARILATPSAMRVVEALPA